MHFDAQNHAHNQPTIAPIPRLVPQWTEAHLLASLDIYCASGDPDWSIVLDCRLNAAVALLHLM
jgi:hypothetical protein